MVAYMIPPYKSNHASTIEVLSDGTLVAAWFSGEGEVCVCLARSLLLLLDWNQENNFQNVAGGQE